MIDLNDKGGSGSGSRFGFQAIMRSLERELAKKQGAPAEAAQQLYYDAMEAATEEERLGLIHKALQLDPGNVDVLLTVLRHCPLRAEEEIEVLRKIVALGEQRLGPKVFKELAGAFWGFTETRPYMRARAQLAESLRHAGRIEEAVAEWEAMLKLNPNDNQGVRYALLACYLALKRLEGAGKLFQRYDECPWNTVFAWGRVLERLLVGNAAGAESALAVARKQNRQMEAYLKGQRRLPKHLPESYAPGSKEEAACFAETLLMAWQAHPEAQRWLASQPPGKGPQRGPKGR